MSTATDLEAWKSDFQKRAKIFSNVFGTTDGAVVLGLLKKYFGADKVFDENPYKTARNAGQHELVQYIEVLTEKGNEI